MLHVSVYYIKDQYSSIYQTMEATSSSDLNSQLAALEQQLIEEMALDAEYFGHIFLKDYSSVITADEDISRRSTRCFGSSSEAEQCTCGIKILENSNGSGPDQPKSANLNNVSLSNFTHETVPAKTVAIASKASRKEEDCEAHISKGTKMVLPHLEYTNTVLPLVNRETKEDSIKYEVGIKPKLLSFKQLIAAQQLISNESVACRPNSGISNSVSLSNYAHQALLARTAAITSKRSRKEEDYERPFSKRIKMVSPRLQCTDVVWPRINGETKEAKIKYEAKRKPKMLSFRRSKAAQQLIQNSGNGPDRPNSGNLNSVTLSNYANQTDLAKIKAITSKRSRKEDDYEKPLSKRIKTVSPRLQCASVVLPQVNGETNKAKIKHEVKRKPKPLSFRQSKPLNN